MVNNIAKKSGRDWNNVEHIIEGCDGSNRTCTWMRDMLLNESENGVEEMRKLGGKRMNNAKINKIRKLLRRLLTYTVTNVHCYYNAS